MYSEGKAGCGTVLEPVAGLRLVAANHRSLRCASSLSDLSAADEVYDLQAVAGGDGGVGPAGALDDLAVVLDRDAVPLESHRGDGLGERDRRGQVVEAAVLAVDGEGEGHDLLA